MHCKPYDGAAAESGASCVLGSCAGKRRTHILSWALVATGDRGKDAEDKSASLALQSAAVVPGGLPTFCAYRKWSPSGET